MTRDAAYQILIKHLTNPILIKHSLATEATMRALAPRFNESVEDWGITGLLHDADYDKSKGHPEIHGILLFKLEPNAIPTQIERAIQSHNSEFTHVAPVSKMDWAISCCDELTGLITAVAQMQPAPNPASTKTGEPDKRLLSLTPDLIIKQIKQKDFAKGAKKEHIYECQDKLGIPFEEFVGITLKAMQEIHEALEL